LAQAILSQVQWLGAIALVALGHRESLPLALATVAGGRGKAGERPPRGMLVPRQLWRLLWALSLLLALPAPTSGAEAKAAGNASTAMWFLVPEDDLAAFEAFEYAIMRINEMRTQCNGFRLAPLLRQNYRTTDVFVKDLGIYSTYRLHIEPLHHLAPNAIHVRVARQHSVTDLSLFQVIQVDPHPCDLFSALDDAELMVPWSGKAASRAQSAAMQLLNSQRKILCPQRPLLQLNRVIAASIQPAEGIVMRLVLEMREASESFKARPFTDVVTVSYALDQDVPGECTASPEVYPARSPCEMQSEEEQESATGAVSSSSKQKQSRRLFATREDPAEVGFRSLDDLRLQAGNRTSDSVSGRRLQRISDAAPVGVDVEQDFVDKGLAIPDNFDPRLQRTLCFPRGFSRSQGSCGSSWAFAATAVASFRECLWDLHTGKQSEGLRFFSAQELVSCGQSNGCSGGSPSHAFYYMKRRGVAREVCSAYRLRCFNDNSVISVNAADQETSTPRSKHFEASSESCPLSPDPLKAPCKCLPSVYHLTRPVNCALLPNACLKTQIPHYFKIRGTAAGSTVPEMERHMMQELVSAGPLYISMLVYEDFYDPVSWTESGIYNHDHRRGNLVGKHAVTAVGWGTDADSRDYWLLLNSFGNGWQQEGYFKVMRGESSLQLMKFGAWGVDWSHPHTDNSKANIVDIEVSFSAELSSGSPASGAVSLSSIWLQVSAFTDEETRVLVRIQGLSNTVTGETKDSEYKTKHMLRLDVLAIDLLDDRAELQIWAVDRSENTASWGPFTLEIPSKETFKESQSARYRRLVEGNVTAGAAQMPPLPPPLLI